MAASGLPLKLVVGLGNPGPTYARTRHNAGWWYVDALARRYDGQWRGDARRHCELARIRIGDADLWLAKPLDFMNRSGGPLASVAGFYRIGAQEVLVAHDDIDLPPGVCRLKQGGGHGGHNGLRDVIAHLGEDFWRLRFGVGHPGARELVIDAVLDRPSPAEQQAIDDALDRAQAILPLLLTEGAQRATHQLHSGNPKSARTPPGAGG